MSMLNAHSFFVFFEKYFTCYTLHMRLHISWPVVISTLQKFTLSFLCWVAALVLIVYMNHHMDADQQQCITKALLTLLVFSPLIVSAEWAWVMQGNAKVRLLGSAATIVVALMYAFLWMPGNLDWINEGRYATQIVTHALLTRASLVWIVPALMKWAVKDTRAHTFKIIWDTIITGIFCWALFGGLAAAMWAVDYLFNITIDGKRYGDLASVIFLWFGSLFWLSHLSIVPTIYNYTKENFPKVLRIFAEYILWFLLVIYACILLAYTFKIVVSGVWPNGMVASLIFGFVAMWMVYSAILLPRTIDSPSGHLRSRLLGAAFIGCAILLVAALHLRVAEYGWTVRRTMIVLIALWMLVLAITLLLVKPSLKWWIISGTVIALVGMYGPINVFNFAMNDQLSRLTRELDSIGITKPWDKAKTMESTQTTQSISSHVNYLLRFHGTWALAQFVWADVMAPQLDEANHPWEGKYATQEEWSLWTAIMNSRWIPYEPNMISIMPDDLANRWISFYAKKPTNISLEWYSKMYSIEAFNEDENHKETTIWSGSSQSAYVMDLSNQTLFVWWGDAISLQPIIDSAKNMQNIEQTPQWSMPIVLTGTNFILYATSLNGEYRNSNGWDEKVFFLSNLEGILLVR